MILVPAIDILDGRAVRLKKGDYAQVTVYNEDAVAQARLFENAGAQRIHIVDLDGARDGAPTNIDVILLRWRITSSRKQSSLASEDRPCE